MTSSPDPSRTVLLAGATGYIGRAVARQLVAAGYHVVALVRAVPENQRGLEGCEFKRAQVTNPGQLAQALAGLEARWVISCLASRSGEPKDAWRVDAEANAHLLEVARRMNAQRFVLLSAICVQKPRLEFQAAKLAFEQRLVESGLEYCIVRPTAFFKSLSGQIQRVQSGKPFLVFGEGTETACKPISERDLAAFIVASLERPDRANQTLPIGGPGPALTPREQGQLLFELTGKPPRFRSVPPGLFKVVAALLKPLGAVLPGLAAKAELARIGHYYATESMLVWDEGSQTYQADATPETGADTLRQHYERVLAQGLAQGLAGQELGDHKLF